MTKDIENPETIEIHGLKTIHKLCKFGADNNMEGCSFTEIVERMFSKIEQMKTQINTLDEILLNQGEALAQAKAKAIPDGFVVVPVEPCKWTKDEDSNWWTQCGEGFVFNEDSHPHKHNFKNCCFCGGLLEAARGGK